MSTNDINLNPIHLGLGVTAEIEPLSTGEMGWYADYEDRHVKAGPGQYVVNEPETALFAFAGEKEEEFLELKEMTEAGKIRSIVAKIYPPEQAAEAHRLVETEQRLGIVVISMDES